MEKTIDPIAVGKKLATLRGNRTRKEVSNDLNISESALAMYEAGERTPRDNIKIRISNYYNVPITELFF